MSRAPFPRWLATRAACLGLAAARPMAGPPTPTPAPGTVYLVLGSDTAVWNYPGGVNIYVHTNHFSPALYSDPAGRAHAAMDPAFRAQFSDSFGGHLKLTWWMLVGSVYGASDNQDTPVPNLMPLHLMQHYHGAALRGFGDELTLHYHTFKWTDYNGDGTSYWNQTPTFGECRADFDRAVCQALVEEGVFTVTFRSGWHFMDDEWQQYCDRLWPYNMDNDWPTKASPRSEPYFNLMDWSLAPTNFVPFHPARTNYQVPGDGAGWNVRSVKMPNVAQPLVDGIFDAAQAGDDQVVSFWAHLPEFDFLAQLQRMDQLVHAAAASHPGVAFRYCTAVEAMQRWRRTTDTTPPDLRVDLADDDAGGTTILVATDEPIFQPEPFVALKDTSRNLRIVPCVADGPNRWRATTALPRAAIAKIGVAATDPAGNLATKLLPLVPDDAFVDDLAPGYHDTGAPWYTRGSPAWGTDAREAVLKPGEHAGAAWDLPVAEARDYAVHVQVPATTNAPAAATYSVYSGDELVASATPRGPMPANRWVRLATVSLDPARPATLRLDATGTPGGPSAALADVVKLTPLVRDDASVAVTGIEATSTGAAVTWTTTRPATGWAEAGTDIRYGSRSAAEPVATTRHVSLLRGLKPGTRQQCVVAASDAAGWSTATTEFATPAGPDPAPVLRASRDEAGVLLYWASDGYVLQRAEPSGRPAWKTVDGADGSAPWRVDGEAAAWFRLATKPPPVP